MLQKVNGQRVYVIRAPERRMATTSTGESFAQMYTQLRWQIFEQIQEDVAQRDEWAQQGYEAQMSLYEDVASQLRDQIQDLQELKTEVLNEGRITPELRARMSRSARNSGGSSGTLTRTVEQSTDPFTGEPQFIQDDGTVSTNRTDTPATKIKRVYKTPLDSVAAEAEAQEIEQMEDTPADTASLDAEIARLEQELAGLDVPTRPELQGAAGAVQQFREGVGTIGKKGGMFGVAQEGRPVREQLSRTREIGEQLREEAPVREPALTQEADALSATRGSVMDEQSPALREAMSLFGDMPLEEGRADAGMTMPAAEPTALTEGAGRLSADPTSELDRALAMFGDDVPEMVQQQPTATRGQDIAPTSVPMEEPPPIIRDFDAPQEIVTPDIIRDYDAGPEGPSGGIIRDFDAGMPQLQPSPESVVTAPVAAPVAEPVPTPAQPAPAAPTRQQRRNRYAAQVVQAGVELANKPKKFERIAKTSLPDSDRPAHIVVVDRLYNVNNGKTNAVQMTYDEISRHYHDSPDVRAQAHEYLFAKNILEGDIEQPLA